MTTRESTAYATLRDKAFTRLDRIDRIENRVGQGIPDVTYTIAGHDGWIELKAPTEPRRADTPLLGSSHNHPLLAEQMNWFDRHLAAGGRAFVYIETETSRLLMPGKIARRLNDMTILELQTLSLWCAKRGPGISAHWATLRALLKG